MVDNDILHIPECECGLTSRPKEEKDNLLVLELKN